ncbi:MAG: hypothetical protein JST65_11170 [Acidobacteria bacterium]|nr:hypothetical protein [Acidobacteriota bacterium]
MKVLLDECITHRLRSFLVVHDCQSANYAGFSGLRNGNLLAAAEAAGFDVIVTLDKGIAFQQSLEKHRIAMIVLRAPSSALVSLKPLVPKLLEALSVVQPGQIMSIQR